MNRENDVGFELAYGAPVTFAAVLETSSVPHNPVNVTGYTARMEVLQYDGSAFGVRRLQITNGAGIVVGTVDGSFAATISGAQAAALSAFFGAAPVTEPARFRMFVTPPLGTEVELVHGAIALLPAGSAITPVTASVDEATFSVSVTALAPVGADGADGAAGPPGPVTVDGKVTTSSTTATVISTVTVPLSKSFTINWPVSEDVSGDRIYQWQFAVSGSCNGAGVVTLDPITIPRSALNYSAFDLTTGTAQVNLRAYPGVATSTVWKAQPVLAMTAS